MIKVNPISRFELRSHVTHTSPNRSAVTKRGFTSPERRTRPIGEIPARQSHSLKLGAAIRDCTALFINPAPGNAMLPRHPRYAALLEKMYLDDKSLRERKCASRQRVHKGATNRVHPSCVFERRREARQQSL